MRSAHVLSTLLAAVACVLASGSRADSLAHLGFDRDPLGGVSAVSPSNASGPGWILERASLVVQAAFAAGDAPTSLDAYDVCHLIDCGWASSLPDAPRAGARAVPEALPEAAPPRRPDFDRVLDRIEQSLMTLQVAQRHERRASVEVGSAAKTARSVRPRSQAWDPRVSFPCIERAPQDAAIDRTGPEASTPGWTEHAGCVLAALAAGPSMRLGSGSAAVFTRVSTVSTRLDLTPRGPAGSTAARSSDPVVVPEPDTALLLAFGLSLLAGRARRSLRRTVAPTPSASSCGARPT